MLPDLTSGLVDVGRDIVKAYLLRPSCHCTCPSLTCGACEAPSSCPAEAAPVRDLDSFWLWVCLVVLAVGLVLAFLLGCLAGFLGAAALEFRRGKATPRSRVGGGGIVGSLS